MNIPEFRIKDKVVSIMGKLGYKQQSQRLEANRAAARIANLCCTEFDRVSREYSLHEMAEFQRHMCIFIHHTVKTELK